jgi:hypothetical protein
MTIGTMAGIEFGGILLRTDASQTPPVAATSTPRPTIVVFNMSAVMKDYDIVFAYTDSPTTPEEQNAVMKELKMKPFPAKPCFVAKRVDITGVVIQTLNAWAITPPPIPE